MDVPVYMPKMCLVMGMSWLQMQVSRHQKTLDKNLTIFKVTSEHKLHFNALDAVSLPMIGTIRVVHNHSHTRTDNYSFNPSAILAFV